MSGLLRFVKWIKRVLDKLRNAPAHPDPGPVTPLPPSPDPGGHFHDPEPLTLLPGDVEMINCAARCEEGVLVAVSNVFRGPNRVRVVRVREDGGALLSEPIMLPDGRPYGNQETLVGGITYMNEVHFNAEHSPRTIVYRGGKMHWGINALGRWGGGTMVYEGEVYMAFNNEYGAGRVFHDKAKLVNVRTGRVWREFPRPCFPFKLLGGEDYVWYAICGNGWSGLYQNDRGRELWDDTADFNQMAVYHGTLYLGGGSNVGRGNLNARNGRIYRLDGNRIHVLADTGCAAITDMKVRGNALYICGIDPDTVLRYDGTLETLGKVDGVFGKRAIGSALEFLGGDLLWFRTGAGAEAYRLRKK